MAGKTSERGRQTARDMVLSLLAVLGVVAVAYAVVPTPDTEAVKAVPYGTELATARRAAPYPVLAPEGLGADWRATSVRYRMEPDGSAVWHLGFVTPDGAYAALEQRDADRDTVVGDRLEGAEADGSAPVAGRPWERLRGDGGRRALVHESGGAVTLVTGSAAYDELTELAAALR